MHNINCNPLCFMLRTRPSSNQIISISSEFIWYITTTVHCVQWNVIFLSYQTRKAPFSFLAVLQNVMLGFSSLLNQDHLIDFRQDKRVVNLLLAIEFHPLMYEWLRLWLTFENQKPSKCKTKQNVCYQFSVPPRCRKIKGTGEGAWHIATKDHHFVTIRL